MISDAGGGVEIARRLVSQQNGRVVHERSRDRNTLPLAAGKFVRLVAHPLRQIHLLQRMFRLFDPRFGRCAVIDQRQFHVVKRRSARQRLNV